MGRLGLRRARRAAPRGRQARAWVLALAGVCLVGAGVVALGGSAARPAAGQPAPSSGRPGVRPPRAGRVPASLRHVPRSDGRSRRPGRIRAPDQAAAVHGRPAVQPAHRRLPGHGRQRRGGGGGPRPADARLRAAPDRAGDPGRGRLRAHAGPAAVPAPRGACRPAGRAGARPADRVQSRDPRGLVRDRLSVLPCRCPPRGLRGSALRRAVHGLPQDRRRPGEPRGAEAPRVLEPEAGHPVGAHPQAGGVRVTFRTSGTCRSDWPARPATAPSRRCSAWPRWRPSRWAGAWPAMPSGAARSTAWPATTDVSARNGGRRGRGARPGCRRC